MAGSSRLSVRPRLFVGAAAVVLAAAVGGTAPVWANSGAGGRHAEPAGVASGPDNSADTRTPIKHVVVLFDENISFDHYFGTYPRAANTDGTHFTARRHTPKVNGLSHRLLTHNPNAYDPKRLGHAHALTCDQDHDYGPEQKSFDAGKMDKFVENTEVSRCTGEPVLFGEPGLDMEYFDGNTVTGLWNYAQNFALSDNSYDATFGPSTPGALELVSGQTHGVHAVDSVTHKKVSDSSIVKSPNSHGIGTVTTDPDPAFDDCSDSNHTTKSNLAVMTGHNIGTRLNARHVTWGWFQGGFRPTGHAHGYAVCGATHDNIGGNAAVDYSPHHEPFQYYASTANPKHLSPSSVRAIGHTDRANHQYDLKDFNAAVKADNLPAVSFLKAPEYQDGHAGYSDPIDEQHFLASEINRVQRSPQWKSTAIVVAYDDSDGWYDHQRSPILNGSHDAKLDTAMCSAKKATHGYQDRCGYGPRLPMLVISPYTKANYVSHRRVTQPSIIRFIEDNWGARRVGDGSFDATAGSLTGSGGLIDLRHPNSTRVLLRPNGSVIGGTRR